MAAVRVLLVLTCAAWRGAAFALAPVATPRAVSRRAAAKSWPRRRVVRGAAEVDAGAAATPKGRALAEKLKNVNVILVGMMGSGKSSVGEGVSRRLGSYAFVDTDATVEAAAGRSVADIFDAEGEAGFREAETAVVEQVAAFVRLVIATGGGAVTTQKNWASLRTGIVVFLDAPVDVLVGRLTAAGEVEKRPLLAGAEDLAADLAAKLEDRRALYAQADVAVAVRPDDDNDAVVDRVLDDVLAFIVANPPKTEPSPP